VIDFGEVLRPTEMWEEEINLTVMQSAAGSSPQEAVTRLLVQWKSGSKEALDLLTPIVYDELRRLAAHYLSDEHAARTLQPTALVNEAYLRLVAQKLPDWESRSHFFGVAAQLMRQILVDHARKRRSAKRGSGVANLALDQVVSFASSRGRDLEALDDALKGLEELDPQQSRIVELRFFGGLSVEEVAEVLHVSPRTVKRDWAFCRAWLNQQLVNL